MIRKLLVVGSALALSGAALANPMVGGPSPTVNPTELGDGDAIPIQAEGGISRLHAVRGEGIRFFRFPLGFTVSTAQQLLGSAAPDATVRGLGRGGNASGISQSIAAFAGANGTYFHRPLGKSGDARPELVIVDYGCFEDVRLFYLLDDGTTAGASGALDTKSEGDRLGPALAGYVQYGIYYIDLDANPNTPALRGIGYLGTTPTCSAIFAVSYGQGVKVQREVR